MTIEDNTLEVVEEIKLLGVKMTSDLKCHCNTSYISQKAYSRLWLMRRLKQLGANNKELIDVYCKQVRSVLEFGAVVWHPSLTQINTNDIERVQKSAIAIILGKNDLSYENSLLLVGLEKLTKRRESLCLHFARKSLKSHPNWYVEDKKICNTRQKNKEFKQVITRTKRFKKSAIPYLTHLLNVHGSVNC